MHFYCPFVHYIDFDYILFLFLSLSYISQRGFRIINEIKDYSYSYLIINFT